jgi:hypothetical protein
MHVRYAADQSINLQKREKLRKDKQIPIYIIKHG